MWVTLQAITHLASPGGEPLESIIKSLISQYYSSSSL